MQRWLWHLHVHAHACAQQALTEAQKVEHVNAAEPSDGATPSFNFSGPLNFGVPAWALATEPAVEAAAPPSCVVMKDRVLLLGLESGEWIVSASIPDVNAQPPRVLVA